MRLSLQSIRVDLDMCVIGVEINVPVLSVLDLTCALDHTIDLGSAAATGSRINDPIDDNHGSVQRTTAPLPNIILLSLVPAWVRVRVFPAQVVEVCDVVRDMLQIWMLRGFENAWDGWRAGLTALGLEELD